MESTDIHKPRYIVVVGASAEGLNSVVELCGQLTDDVDAAVFVVLHLSKISMSELLINRFQKNTTFTCTIAEHEESIMAGHVYLAVPDKHLIIKKDKVLLGDGPPEHRWRPSIDVLFRSAAVAYDSRVIGIIMTGLQHDGTAGMQAIKQCGGTCIVQDPREAEYPEMPLSVINNMDVDYCVPLMEMGPILEEKSKNGTPGTHTIPDDIKAEAEIAERVVVGIDPVCHLGSKSLFTCPDCGGSLWEIKADGFSRYRCHTGHVYAQKELLTRQSEALENTLWVALRMLDETKNLLDKMSEEEQNKGWIKSAASNKEKSSDLKEHIYSLKKLLIEIKKEQ